VPIDGLTITFYFVALGTLALMHAVLKAVLRQRRKYPPTADGPRCEGCGYILFGEAEQVCPECGRDSRIDLRVDQLPPRPVPPVAVTLAVALLLFPLTIAAGYPIAAELSGSWRSELETTVTTPLGNVEISARTSGLGRARESHGAVVRILNEKNPRLLMSDDSKMNLVQLGKRCRGLPRVPITREGIAALLVHEGAREGDPEVLEAADKIAALLQGLRDHTLPDELFATEMKGSYVVDPDDNFGPFFWLPKYAPFCVPVWLLASSWLGFRFARRYREAIAKYELVRRRALEGITTVT